MAMNNSARRQRQESPGAIEDRLFRLIVESVTDHAVVGIDLEGRIISWNVGAEKAFGYLEEDIIGESFSTLFSSEDRRRGLPEQELRNAGTSGSAKYFRWQVRKDGSRFWTSGFLNPLRDEAGNPIGYIKVCPHETQKKLGVDGLQEGQTDFPPIFEMGGTGKTQGHLRSGRLLRVN